jgi:glucose/mannose-6-phosphate isomerase
MQPLTLETIRRTDPEGMFDLIKAWPEQWRQGQECAEGFCAEKRAAEANQFVVVGMGGSAIGGDLVRALALAESPVPVQVVRDYVLPASVDAGSIVLVSSYSGNTEETLSTMDEAMERGAYVVCVTSGGEVLARAQEHGFPHVVIPGGAPPRAALGLSLSAQLAIAEHMGVVSVGDGWEEAEAMLEGLTQSLANPSGNDALELARALVDALPVVYSASGLLEAVNLRWRGQMEENAKALAYGNLLPEMNHNEIMGWDEPSDLHGRIGVVVLRDHEDHPRVQKRMDVTRSLLEARAGSWREVSTQGTHRITRVLSLVVLGDWASFYLAMLRGVDPTPIGFINRLKSALSEA